MKKGQSAKKIMKKLKRPKCHKRKEKEANVLTKNIKKNESQSAITLFKNTNENVKILK
jgi:hypothetical protein